MGNGTRHLLGAIAGIVAIPVIFGLVLGGESLTIRAASHFLINGGQWYAAVAILVVGTVILALLVGTRISPLASLIPGVVYTAIGVAGVVAPRTIFQIAEHLAPGRIDVNQGVPFSAMNIVNDAVTTGAYVMVGVLLLVASLAPSRWRAKVTAAAPGAHPVPGGEAPWPPAGPVPSDPAQQRATPPLPADEPPPAHEYPYGSGPQPPYGGSGPQAPYGGSGPQAPYGASPEPEVPYSAPPQPQPPYRSAFEPPESQDAGGGGGGAGEEVPGYAPGNRPSSWSGPQTPYPADPGRSPRPAGDDPYGSPAQPYQPPSAFSQPAEPWGPPPGGEQPPPTRAFSSESDEAAQADPTPRTMPDANANDETHRIPWSEADQARFRDRPER